MNRAAGTWPPFCLACIGVRVELAPQPGDFAMDVGGVKGAGFKAFDIAVEGARVQVDSLHTLRRIERESEQRYRNGEGEPIRFRMWNQTASNKDVHSFGTEGKIGERTYDSGIPPPQRSPKIGVTRHGTKKPKIAIAKGAGQSALKG